MHDPLTPPVRILAISGSLRQGASNTALLAAAARLAPPGVTVRMYTGMAELPHFNPDLEQVEEALLPPPARALRELVRDVDALLLSTPEYAHGLPGSFKNVLDWLVGSVDLPGKPVAILAASARSVHAPAQLREILATMSTRVIEAASALVPVSGGAGERTAEQQADAIVADEARAAVVREALRVLGGATEARRASAPLTGA